MSTKSLNQLVNLARPLLKNHGSLSTAFLMRKLRVEYDLAREIMITLGLPVYVFAEECAIPSKNREYKAKIPKPIIDHKEYARRYYKKREIAYCEARKLPMWEQDMIERFIAECPCGYHVDHIVPIAKGGKHEMANLQYLTQRENIRKSDRWNKETHIPNSCPIKI